MEKIGVLKASLHMEYQSTVKVICTTNKPVDFVQVVAASGNQNVLGVFNNINVFLQQLHHLLIFGQICHNTNFTLIEIHRKKYMSERMVRLQVSQSILFCRKKQLCSQYVWDVLNALKKTIRIQQSIWTSN